MAAWIPGDALVALTAAASWGGGDFSGGMAVKAAHGSTRGALRVVVVAHSASLAVLLLMLYQVPGPRPDGVLLAWGLAAGVAAAVALSALYLALARGAMGVSAAVCGVLGAAIPAIVSRELEGTANALRTAGFALAAAAIWMIAAAPPPADERNIDGAGAAVTAKRQTLGLAIVGGLSFGFYFVALRMDNVLGVLEPLALARVASLATCGLVLLALSLRPDAPRSGTRSAGRDLPSHAEGFPPQQSRGWLSGAALGWALGVAILDTAGDLLFVQATRIGRLDVAAVLTSLYPAATIVLAAVVLQERPTWQQAAGMIVALAAVAMITL